jgi:NAD(P) transhydrogenase subunit alpha
MKIGIPKESHSGEKRVAATPDSVKKLIKLGFSVQIEVGAGTLANYLDAAYTDAGAEMVSGDAAWGESDIVLKVVEPTLAEVERLREGAHLISFIWPKINAELVEKMGARKLTTIAMDKIPRISRAQKMDALSSMSNISGYRAVIEAANEFGSFFTGQMTAAGKVPPAKVLIIGAGVAGLAAIGAAKGLGAIVRAFDVRAATREQVTSLGAEFLEVKIEESGEGGGGYAKVMSEEFIKAEMDLFHAQAQEVDIVITTALIPGRAAPKLWEKRAVEAMKPGSVVVDLAASAGGNCEVCEPGKLAIHNGVKIIGYTDLTSRMARVSSQLYSQNLVHLLKDMSKGEGYSIDLEDEVVRGSIVHQDGELLWPPPKREPPPQAAPKPEPEPEPEPEPKPQSASGKKGKAETPEPQGARVAALVGLILAGLWAYMRFGYDGDLDPSGEFLQQLTVFMLAIFVGWQVVWSVTAALHTPLMSVTNAISGIIIVGGMLQAKGDIESASAILAASAILLATINISGGFLVTHRMLKMFRK